MRFVHAFVMALLVLGTRAAIAQEMPTKPAAGTTVDFPGAAAEITALSDSYLSGDWDSFSPLALALVRKVQTATKATRPAGLFDVTKDYIHLVWVDSLPAADDPTLLSAIIHDPPGDPYSRVIPGLKRGGDARLFEVFVTDNEFASVESFYVSKPLPNPLLEQVPSVVESFIGPLFAAASAAAGSSDLRVMGRVTPPANSLLAVVRQVDLPEARAEVELTMSAALPLDASTELAKLDTRLQSRGFAATSEQSAALSAAIKGLTTVAQSTAPGAPCPADSQGAACKRAMHVAITTALAPVVNNPANAPQRTRLEALEAALRAAVDGLQPAVVKGTFALDNSPLTHLGFGLLTSFAPVIFGDHQRAVVDSNAVSASALPRALQMVVLNWSPNGYQEKTTRRWDPRAFVRPFAGVVFSPDIGVAIGASFMVLSNLGVNAGIAHLFISRPEEGLDIGADLAETLPDTKAFKYSPELRRDPLRVGGLDALFLGVSYNFK